MKLIKYILLGLIQGFTEPLPISSSGHVIIFSYFFNIDIGLDFLTFINLGSLFAIILYYRKSICSLMTGSFKYLYTKDKIFIFDKILYRYCYSLFYRHNKLCKSLKLL